MGAENDLGQKVSVLIDPLPGKNPCLLRPRRHLRMPTRFLDKSRDFLVGRARAQTTDQSIKTPKVFGLLPESKE